MKGVLSSDLLVWDNCLESKFSMIKIRKHCYKKKNLFLNNKKNTLIVNNMSNNKFCSIFKFQNIKSRKYYLILL